MKAPVKRLKMAPISKPSVTPRPMAKPARTSRNPRIKPVRGEAVPSARKFSPKQIGWPATPQQAVDKKSPFKVPARPPRKHARGENFHCRKKNQTLRPRKNVAKGA